MLKEMEPLATQQKKEAVVSGLFTFSVFNFSTIPMNVVYVLECGYGSRYHYFHDKFDRRKKLHMEPKKFRLSK